MKFMVSCRHPIAFLKQVSEIKVDYNDIERLKDFITEDWTCGADIILYIPKDQVIDWNKIILYKDILNITIALEDLSSISEVKKYGFKVFWKYPISSYYELRGILNLGVSQVLLDAPLYFNLPKVKKICGDVEIRLIVNKCFNYMMRADGICGTYVRPEDVDEYAPYVSHMELITNSLDIEKTLYNIYAKDKVFSGNLNLLLTYLGVDVDNRGFEVIPNDENDSKYFAHRRITCGQRCQEDPQKCNFCKVYFNLINSIDQNTDTLKAQLDNINAEKNLS